MPKIKPDSSKTRDEKSNPLSEFRSKGFTPVNKPGIPLPTMPTGISTLTLDKLGDLQAKYSAWREYTEDLLLEAVYEKIMAETTYQEKFDRKLLVMEGKTVTEKKTLTDLDDEVIKYKNKSIHKEVFHTMLSSKLESLNNVLSVLSREISRRGQMNI